MELLRVTFILLTYIGLDMYLSSACLLQIVPDYQTCPSGHCLYLTLFEVLIIAASQSKGSGFNLEPSPEDTYALGRM